MLRPVYIVGSVLHEMLMALSIIVVGVLGMFTAPLPYRYRYWFITRMPVFHTWFFSKLVGAPYRVEGLEHMPDGPLVIMAKHQSTWETFALATVIDRPIMYVLKRELMRIPIFGWALSLLKPIAIDRASGREAVKQMVEQGKQRMAEGISIIIFPEGTRVPPNHKGKYRIGGAVFAAEVGRPVVPVAHNAGYVWGRNQIIKNQRPITLKFGKAIQTQGREPEAILRDVEEAIEGMMREIEPGYEGLPFERKR